MKFLILGAGGIGSYYGAKLLNQSHHITFIARGEHLQAIKNNGLSLKHPEFSFHKKVDACSLEEIKNIDISKIDAIFITTKSTTTEQIAKDLSKIFTDKETMPYFVSLQNGVENEDILCKYFDEKKVIGALTRKIGAHIIKPGYIEVTGVVETILGPIIKTEENEIFVNKLTLTLNNAKIYSEYTNNIKLELWKKLIINNGVNAICALLQIKTGVLMNNKKLNKIVYGLMQETANAAKFLDINISKKDVDIMYELIKNFDSIKPSMLVDREFERAIELEEISGVVIKYNEKQNQDSPYTRTISTLLEFIYKNELK
ncbi:MAG: ketopantoate reductase family protein [Poseidonibacter sp.]|uniref:ketopantoate reductase family protein n=1 Tax=Poseidonibacter sp. TaxID=2321188 RepID=UPI00359CC453